MVLLAIAPCEVDSAMFGCAPRRDKRALFALPCRKSSLSCRHLKQPLRHLTAHFTCRGTCSMPCRPAAGALSMFVRVAQALKLTLPQTLNPILELPRP